MNVFFVYVHGNEAIQKREQGRALDKMGTLLCLAAFCVFFFFCWFVCLFWVFLGLFLSVVVFTFLLSLLHHNETFSTNIHTDPVVVQ